MFSCLQILEAFLWFVLITLLNVTLIILTLSVSRLLNLLLRLVAFLLFLNTQCLASISRWLTASSSWKRFCLFVGIERHGAVLEFDEQPVEAAARHRGGDVDRAGLAQPDAKAQLAVLQALARGISHIHWSAPWSPPILFCAHTPRTARCTAVGRSASSLEPGPAVGQQPFLRQEAALVRHFFAALHP